MIEVKLLGINYVKSEISDLHFCECYYKFHFKMPFSYTNENTRHYSIVVTKMFLIRRNRHSTNMLGIGQSTNIVYNCVQTRWEILPIRVVNLTNIYINPAKVPELQNFCNKIDEFFKNPQYSTSYMPFTISHQLNFKMSGTLKHYFVNHSKYPTMHWTFL